MGRRRTEAGRAERVSQGRRLDGSRGRGAGAGTARRGRQAAHRMRFALEGGRRGRPRVAGGARWVRGGGGAPDGSKAAPAGFEGRDTDRRQSSETDVALSSGSVAVGERPGLRIPGGSDAGARATDSRVESRAVCWTIRQATPKTGFGWVTRATRRKRWQGGWVSRRRGRSKGDRGGIPQAGPIDRLPPLKRDPRRDLAKERSRDWVRAMGAKGCYSRPPGPLRGARHARRRGADRLH